MTPTYSRYADHNARNRELREETDRIGAPYYQGYLEAKARRMKTLEQQQAEAREDVLQKMPQAILGAFEYRGFYDNGKYLDDTLLEHIQPFIDDLVARIHNETREGVLEECILWSREKTDPYNENTYEDVCSKAGYNRALSDIDTHITSLKKTV
jgi:hypothetical protein